MNPNQNRLWEMWRRSEAHSAAVARRRGFFPHWMMRENAVARVLKQKSYMTRAEGESTVRAMRIDG